MRKDCNKKTDIFYRGQISELDLSGKVAVVTGGGGVLGSLLSQKALAECKAKSHGA